MTAPETTDKTPMRIIERIKPVTRRENIRRGVGRGAETVRLEAISGICARGHDLTAPGAWRSKGNGRRVCRLCSNDTARRYRARKAVA